MDERYRRLIVDAPTAVLYDLSALAPVVFHPATYTGVQRVVHEVAAGLASRAEVSLTLHGGDDFATTQVFAKRDPRLARVPFDHEAKLGAWSKLVVSLATNTMRLAAGKRSLPARGARWLAHRFSARLPRVTNLTAAQLAAFRIYHSPVYALPTVVQQARHLCKFLTVYDLTPVKMPEHSVASILDEYRAMLRSVRRDQYFLCISESTKRDWCEHTGSDLTRCFVTPLAAAEHFRPCGDAACIDAVKSRYGLPPGANYFLGLSTLEPRKNIAAVLRAFYDLLRQTRREDLYLVLVGRQGWQAETILAAAKTDAKLRTRVILTGYVPEEDLSALYTGALAFVYLSFYEGFGLPPLEAMQCGTPVVTSNTSSLPEVVADAGVMLEPTDHDGLCATLLKLADNPNWRELMRAKSLAQAARFTWGHCLDATVAAYQQAVAGA